MNLLEKAGEIVRNIDYDLSRTMGVERDPKRIAAFPAHAQDCSRTGPLTITYKGNFALPSGGAVPAFPRHVEKVITECSECSGKIEK